MCHYVLGVQGINPEFHLIYLHVPMKNNSKKLLMLGMLAISSIAHASDVPTGKISADSDVVLAGTFPKLDWKINYPSPVTSLIEITDPGVIVSRSDLTMQVRTLAADVQERREFWNGFRWVVTFRYITVTGYGRTNRSNYNLLFNGTQPFVNPASIVWQRELSEGEEVVFAALANFSGGRWYRSGQNDANVLILTDGDIPPEFATWDTQSTLGTHIAPYLAPDGTIDIGPRDVIVAFELTHVIDRNSNENEGDFQDMIFLLTFQNDED